MIYAANGSFHDEHGRTLLLRGVNLGGSSKVPRRPNGATYMREGFSDHRNVSFVGRPFPLEEADEHFARLAAWGLTFLRFLVTWEAVEHAGPGCYDEEYLDYLYAVVRKAGEHGLQLLIDPHQDVWSRFSGGDGAPGWTLEAVGLEVANLHETGAAVVHQLYGDPFPRMIWPSNGSKLAAATMFTLFFGGNDFAPQVRVDGEPVQEYLQRHYIEAMVQVARKLQGLPNVVGYDTLNEPLAGYIGCQDLGVFKELLKVGECPTPYQGMLLGAGYPQEVGVWEVRLPAPRQVSRRLANPRGVRAWRPGYDCIWRRHGVWDLGADGQPRLLRPDYFTTVAGRPVSFGQDYYRPFANRYARAIRAVEPAALVFVETHVGQAPPRWGSEDVPAIVYAPHWYDALVLMTKRYNRWVGVDMGTGKLLLGPGGIRRGFASLLANYGQEAAERLGGAPVLLGECGIPFDLDEKKAYRGGGWQSQLYAADRTMRALEDTLLSFTWWNYTADNSNARGDQWNDEDLSIFSRDQQVDPADIHSGGRALPALVRPYPRATAGTPLRLSFDMRSRILEFSFRHDPAVTAPTEILVPGYQYPQGFEVEVSDGAYEVDAERQLVVYRHGDEQQEHTVRVRPA